MKKMDTKRNFCMNCGAELKGGADEINCYNKIHENMGGKGKKGNYKKFIDLKMRKTLRICSILLVKNLPH